MRDSIDCKSCRQTRRVVRSDGPSEVFRKARIPSIIPVSDLRRDAARVLKKTRSSDEPVFVTPRGRPPAVLMSIEAYERSANERGLLLLPARGEREIASGVGHDLDSVSADAARLLADD